MSCLDTDISWDNKTIYCPNFFVDYIIDKDLNLFLNETISYDEKKFPFIKLVFSRICDDEDRKEIIHTGHLTKDCFGYISNSSCLKERFNDLVKLLEGQPFVVNFGEYHELFGYLVPFVYKINEFEYTFSLYVKINTKDLFNKINPLYYSLIDYDKYYAIDYLIHCTEDNDCDRVSGQIVKYMRVNIQDPLSISTISNANLEYRIGMKQMSKYMFNEDEAKAKLIKVAKSITNESIGSKLTVSNNKEDKKLASIYCFDKKLSLEFSNNDPEENMIKKLSDDGYVGVDITVCLNDVPITEINNDNTINKQFLKLLKQIQKEYNDQGMLLTLSDIMLDLFGYLIIQTPENKLFRISGEVVVIPVIRYYYGHSYTLKFYYTENPLDLNIIENMKKYQIDLDVNSNVNENDKSSVILSILSGGNILKKYKVDIDKMIYLNKQVYYKFHSSKEDNKKVILPEDDNDSFLEGILDSIDEKSCFGNLEATEPFKFKVPMAELSWEDYFMELAKLTSKRSKDPVTKVGAVIIAPNKRIVSIGYNGLPNGCNEEDFPWDKSDDITKDKRSYIVHAELNAILNTKADLNNCKIYVTVFPCKECFKAIIQSGIKEVVYLEESNHKYEDLVVRHMAVCTGVKIVKFKK